MNRIELDLLSPDYYSGADSHISEIRSQAATGILNLLNFFNPDMRGHRVLSCIYPPDSKLLEYRDLQLMQGLILGYQPVQTQAERCSGIIPLAWEFLNDPVLAAKAQQDIALLVDSLVEVARKRQPFFDPLLIEPDTDFKLNSGLASQDIVNAWCDQKLEPQRLIPVGSEADIYYGWICTVLPTRNPGLDRASIVLGYFEKRNGGYVLIQSDSRVDFIPQTSEGIADYRGAQGLSTDRIRARHLGNGLFEVRQETVPTNIEFPAGEVLTDTAVWLELASRAITQRTRHQLDIQYPEVISNITPDIAQGVFRQDFMLLNAVVNNIRDSFLFDAKETFSLCNRFGFWDALPITAIFTQGQRQCIYSRLPTRDDNLAQLSRNINLPVEVRYSTFGNFIELLNEVGHLSLPPTRDWLIIVDLFTDK